MQLTNYPPLPFLPQFLPADTAVYLNPADGSFVYDDLNIDYVAVEQQRLAELDTGTTNFPPNPGQGGSGSDTNVYARFDPALFGCGLWLSLSPLTNGSAILSLNNSRAGQTYFVWSSTNLALTNWVLETNILGSASDPTIVTIAMGTRSNLFLRASEVRDYVIATNITGLGYSEVQVEVPDTMGAVGPDHFIELLNDLGVSSSTTMRVYDKSRNLIAATNGAGFFTFTSAGVLYPTNKAALGPHIIYDHHSHRWIACALDGRSGNQAMLAVSTSENPTNLTTGWRRYLVDVLTNTPDSDFPNLGVDDNGIYITVALNTNFYYAGHAIVAIKKPEIYEGEYIAHRFALAKLTESMPVAAIVPAVNFDHVPTNAYAWFVASGPPSLGSNCLGGEVWYRRLQWVGTNGVLDTNWWTLPEPSPTYRDYYDLVITNVWAPEAASESGSPIRLWPIGSRLTTAVIRDGLLWTCQAVGLNRTNGVYLGDGSPSGIDRSGVQWLKISVDPAAGSLNYVGHGRFWDAAPTNAYWYYFPSLMVNCAGDLVASFSGSNATNYIGAFYGWRSATGASNSAVPRLIQAGLVGYPYYRWGDYSATTLDPTDQLTFWTVQEYACPQENDYHWGTVISRLVLYP